MNEFKSKTNISDYVIPMKVKQTSLSRILTFLLLNERIQIENDYSLSNPYETKARYSFSCIWKPEVSTIKLRN